MGFIRKFPKIETNVLAKNQAKRPVCPEARFEGTLIDPRFDFDSCGVGFVAQLSAQPSYEILDHALTALAGLEHRGAVAADGKSSDGGGVTTAIPREWLLLQSEVELSPRSPLGVAVAFLPLNDSAQREEFSAALAAQNCRILAWRPVPVRPEVLGEIANAARPEIWHVLITSDVRKISMAGYFSPESNSRARKSPATLPASRRGPWSTRRCALAACWPSFTPTSPLRNS